MSEETPNFVTWAEMLAEEVRPETGEMGYRRGYCDGWMMALEAIWDTMHRYSRSDAYDITFTHAEGPLSDWMLACKEGDDGLDSANWPPAYRVPKKTAIVPLAVARGATTIPYAEVKERLLRDPAVRRAYDALQPAYEAERERIARENAKEGAQ